MPANKPYIVGLTGGIGCGKSEAANHLKNLGAVHVDADGISRAMTAPGGQALLRDCMENVVRLAVPLKTDISVGGDWRACK